MLQAVGALLLIVFNFIIYFLFGAVICVSKDRKMSLTRTIFAGLFFYYLLFTLCCIPIMLRWRPLHVLTAIWRMVIIVVAVIGAVRCRKVLPDAIRRAHSFVVEHKIALLLIALMSAAFVAIILLSFQFTLDASFYVGNATTALQTDTINMYDPFTGEWLDHYEMRYFFATFPMNDAVMCSLFHVHPLIWCKITMAGTAMLLTIMVLYMVAVSLFAYDMKRVVLFLFFSIVANFFMITIYTTSAFLTTRNYEGKCLLANIVLPGIFYIYIRLLKDVKDRRSWMLLLLAALGAPVLSSSANMLVPAMIGVTILPLVVIKKDITVIPKSIVCMIPGLMLTLIYILYVKNIVVFYTYPR